MFFLYNLLGFFFLIISPVIILIRVVIGKEDIKRVLEKYSFFRKEKFKATVWFHGASVGEIMSILPIIKKFENDKSIKKILLTSTTVSSASIIEKKKLKKTTHVYFPFDVNFICNNFLKIWKPKIAIFVDSEIWPNMFNKLETNGIPIILINGRITKKSFLKWNFFQNFSKKIFSNFNLCLVSNKESIRYLNKLGASKIKFLGNLKYSQSENENVKLNNSLRKFLFSKKIWCASSTHNSEERFCGSVHKELKKKYNNLLTIIIPRHIDRVNEIENELRKLNLNVHIHDSQFKIDKEIDIYLVNAYGKTKSFFNYCKNVFLGGSIINHGGQNPLEAARYGCNILHGPNTHNFKEIYNFLKKNKISQKINSEKQIVNYLDKYFKKKQNSKIVKKKINSIGQKILENTHKEVKLILKNEIQKT